MQGAVSNCDIALYATKGTANHVQGGSAFDTEVKQQWHTARSWKPTHVYRAHGYIRGEVLRLLLGS